MRQFFLWTHLYDPHRPYEPPEPFASRYGSDLYVGEIAYADSQIGRLFDALNRRQLLEDTLVIVTGDHGESLGEHGERDHGVFIYESVLRIPLMIRAPGVAPRRVSPVVRLIDVMPTVLDVLACRPPPIDGISLLELMRGGRGQELEAYSESEYPRRLGWSPLRSLRDGRFKVDRCASSRIVRPRARPVRNPERVSRTSSHGRRDDATPGHRGADALTDRGYRPPRRRRECCACRQICASDSPASATSAPAPLLRCRPVALCPIPRIASTCKERECGPTLPR